ncbi:MAG: tRNA 2-thiouridine(34) synthase MnmA [Desulforhopalus sp.]
MKIRQIGVAMSGGVDSTACALLLREHYRVKGFFMQLAQPNFSEQRRRLEGITEDLGLELQVIDLRLPFEKKVLDYFSSNYFRGLTPNPCVVCNKEIKFGLFLDAILEAGMDQMATGHYARVIENDGMYHLLTGSDRTKDQSYFLSRLCQYQLKNVLFPLGETTKEDIYTLVEKHGLGNFRGLESQDVCFLDKRTVGDYLEGLPESHRNPGPIMSTAGAVLGRHQGLYRYTIGQRKGLGISSSAPLYVIGIDIRNNSLIVGGNDDLWRKSITVHKLHWLSSRPPAVNRKFTVRLRSTHKGAAAVVNPYGDSQGKIIFDEPQRAVTPGQFAVIYNKSEVLGSGIID